MLDACESIFPECNLAVMAAAVADYAPASVADRKIKRETARMDSIPLVKNPDIAATLGHCKRPDQRVVGFALETDHAIEHGRDKITRKGLDAVVVNSLADKGAGFGVDTNCVTILFADDSQESVVIPLKPKREVADDIINVIKDL